MIIRTASQQAAVRRAGGYRRFVEQCAAARWAGMACVNWEQRGEVRAYVARSSWRVDCPWCREAIVAEPGEGFFCPNCMMVANEGKAAAVVFPAEREEIERALLMRVDPETRNWLLHETVEDLLRENLEHGELRIGA